MCGIGEALNNLFPTGWLDPYGSMPLNKEYSVQIDITQVETDDGIKITAVKTPPRASTTSVQDAINMALGIGCCEDIAEREDYQDSKGNITERENKKTQEDKQDFGKEDKSTDKESENDDEPSGNDNKQYSSRGQSSETGRSRSPR